jgi:hypothetical protein
MTIRAPGVDSAIPAIPQGQVGPTGDPAPATGPGEGDKAGPLAGTPQDGVDVAPDAAFDPGPGGPDATPTVGPTQALPEPVGIAEILRLVAGGALGADGGFQSLAALVQGTMQGAAKNGSGALVDALKRLANSPQFRKLGPEVQAKIVDQLTRLAGDKATAQQLERLVRSKGFAALPEKEQLRMIADVTNSKTASETQAKLTEPAAHTTINIPSGGDAVPVATLIHLATMNEAAAGDPGLHLNAQLQVDPQLGGSAPGGAAPEQSASYLAIKRLIAALRAAPDLTPAVLGPLLGVALAPRDAGTPPDDRVGSSTIVSGHAASGPFFAIELQGTAIPAGQRLDLEVRTGIRVLYREFRGDLIPATVAPQIDVGAGPGGTDTLSFAVTDPWPQEVRFTFDSAGRLLVKVSLRRGQG